jgi:oligopeptide transport system ATP-binding protein
MTDNNILLEVSDLRTEFRMREGTVHAVNGIDYCLRPGDAFGIVGESGCGKSVSVLSLMRLIDEPPGHIAGSAKFQGKDLLSLSHEEMRHIRGRRMAMIFQDPMTSLNPVLTVGLQLSESLREHLGLDEAAAGRRAIELLELVGIPSARERVNAYPHQFSGGMRQRVMIAMAVSCDPKLLIADEPTTALDVTIQAQILDLMRRLRRELGTAVILITHDLGVVAGLCDRVAVMYAGYFVEESPVVDLFDDPRHPYTLGLLKSIPRIDRERSESLTPIEGSPPDLVNLTPGCPFAPRCPFVISRCQAELPALVEHSPGRRARCWVDVRTGAPV